MVLGIVYVESSLNVTDANTVDVAAWIFGCSNLGNCDVDHIDSTELGKDSSDVIGAHFCAWVSSADGHLDFDGDSVVWFDWVSAVWSRGVSWFAYWVVVSITCGIGGGGAEWALWAAFTISGNPQLFVALWSGTENCLAVICWDASSTAGKILLDEGTSWWASLLCCAIQERAVWEWNARTTAFTWFNDQFLVGSTGNCWATDLRAVDDWLADLAAFLYYDVPSFWAACNLWASES